ncbi:MAG: DUF1850 domain-containing protein [Bradyrhizobiaceae bacterium]|nr:MAG: DUF1850 domain-containing protein [Bradyrhizobiaceae bacterium]
MSLCLVSAGVIKTLSVTAFMLAWTHSVEKSEWQEDWRVTPRGLQIVEARVQGTGAGMEPPPEARLADGWFRWKPHLAEQSEVALGNSGMAGEWRLCTGGKCRTLSDILGHPVGANVTTMRVCDASATPVVPSDEAALCKSGSQAGPDAVIRACNVALNREAASVSEKIDVLRVRAAAWRAKGERRRALDDYDTALRLAPAHEAVRAERKSLFHEIELQGATMPLKRAPKP